MVTAVHVQSPREQQDYHDPRQRMNRPPRHMKRQAVLHDLCLQHADHIAIDN